MHHDNNDNGDNDNDNKLQTARVLCVKLKKGPEHRVHIVALLCEDRWQRPSWSTELCVKKSSVH